MTTIKWLVIFALLPGLIAAQSSGSFTTIDFDDSYLDYSAPTTNFGTIVSLKVGHQSGRQRAVLRCEDCDDSLNNRVCDSATITLDVTGVKGTLSLDDSIEVHALLNLTAQPSAFTETQVTYNIRYTDNNWNTAGAEGEGTDYWATRIAAFSVAGWTTSTNLVIDVEMAFDSSKFGGFLIRSKNFDNGDTLLFASHDVLIGTAPTGYVQWHETTYVQTMFCNDAALTGSTTRWNVSEMKMLSYNAYGDSIQLRIDPKSTQIDSIIPVTYKNFSNDSAQLEFGTDTAYTASEAACTDFMLHLSGTTLYLGDSNYFVGAAVQSAGAGGYGFCTVAANASVGLDSAYYAAGAPPDPITGTRDDNRICFKMFFTAEVGGGQVIIIGSCWDEDTPYYHKETGQWSNIPSL